LSRRPDFSLAETVRREPFKRQEDLDHLLEGLRKAGVPD
jgi:adenylate cyclase